MSDSIQIQLKGDKRIFRKLTNLPKNLRFELGKVVFKTCLDIQSDAEFNSPRDTDDLVSGWHSEMIREMEGRVFNDKKHAIYMETGYMLRQRTKSGWRVIKPKNASSKYAPVLILNERVAHPINQPGGYRMLEQAAVDNEKTLIKNSRRVLFNAWKKG